MTFSNQRLFLISFTKALQRFLFSAAPLWLLSTLTSLSTWSFYPSRCLKIPLGFFSGDVFVLDVEHGPIVVFDFSPVSLYPGIFSVILQRFINILDYLASE